MTPKHHHNWTLITRILSDEADVAEKEEFQQWLKKDPANEKFFDELKVSWQKEPHKDAANSAHLFDHESGLRKLRQKLNSEERNNTIKLKSNSVINRHFLGWKVAASALLVIVAISVFAAFHFSTPSMVSYATSNVGQRIINLPDGSKVRLNKNSKISFAKGFSGPTRKIILSGEAFFHVKHNAEKPFIIHAGNAVIRDIGTSFNVKERKNGMVIVAVKNGVASLRYDKMKKEDAIVLKKNQVGILKNRNITKIESGGMQNYLSWMTGKIEFEKMPFDQVIRQISNIYGIHCQLAAPSLSSLKLTAYIRNTSLNDVLHMISLSLDIKYRKKGNTVIWMQENTTTSQQPPKQNHAN